MRGIAVIGGGASGIAAAITAADAGVRVTLLEAGKRIGHSILASGNGRCNFSNSQVGADAYWNADFVGRAFGACPPKRVWEWLSDLGLMWSAEAEGRLYPLANKASSVLDVLRFALEERGVQVECGCEVERVAPEGGGWRVFCGQGAPRPFDAVVLACGGSVARGMLPGGYRFIAQQPRLCPLRTDRDAVKGLDNVRVRAIVSLHGADGAGAPLAIERGEVQFRSHGVSGIAVFNLSRFAREGCRLYLDLLPPIPEGRLEAELARRARSHPGRSAERLLAGIALPLVSRAVLRQAGIPATGRILPGDAPAIVRAFKRFPLRVEGFEGHGAQVARGGVAVGQVDPATMESRADAGLFIAGEALDVDGPCGGYNLHWAWTSGLLAGAAAGRG